MVNNNDLIGRSESKSSLVGFEDKTDVNAPKLNYAIPLPAMFEGHFFIETEFEGLKWGKEALQGVEKPKVSEIAKKGNILEVMPLVASSKVYTAKAAKFDVKLTGNPEIEAIKAQNLDIPLAVIETNEAKNRYLHIYEDFGGFLNYTFIPNETEENANPRFIIVEYYRLSSIFGDYGAGRTLSTFTLWPGEKTEFYVRSWRRTEERLKEASSIFDSYTEEAAAEFEKSVENENSYKFEYEKTKSWKASGGFSLNLGICKIGGGGGGGGSSKTSHEFLAKTVSKVSCHHSSKKSAKRETTVSTELESAEFAEHERITKRKVENVNLSRVLNIVCRELNQEFETYLSLIGVAVAFVNDRQIYEEVPLYDIDRLLNKYLADDPSRKMVKDEIINQMSQVIDFEGSSIEFIVEDQHFDGTKYWKVKKSTDPNNPNPFYPVGKIPVEGIVLEYSNHTVRTDAVIMDSLLGHGVALDNYELGKQQQKLINKQLANKQMELALSIVEEEDDKKRVAYRTIFCPCEKREKEQNN
ncbi:MAG: hypothetical protein ACTSPN_11780 [Promethearchaeota archaeon]